MVAVHYRHKTFTCAVGDLCVAPNSPQSSPRGRRVVGGTHRRVLCAANQLESICKLFALRGGDTQNLLAQHGRAQVRHRAPSNLNYNLSTRLYPHAPSAYREMPWGLSKRPTCTGHSMRGPRARTKSPVGRHGAFRSKMNVFVSLPFRTALYNN